MNPKVVVIGAGSTIFGLGTLATLLRSERLRGSTLALVDLNADGLNLMDTLARRLNREWAAAMTIESSTSRQEALPGAHFVVVSIETGPREGLWRRDWEIPLAFGVRQPYGENGGPGGFAHTLRQVPEMLGSVDIWGTISLCQQSEYKMTNGQRFSPSCITVLVSM
jgi:alpha-galactosidase